MTTDFLADIDKYKTGRYLEFMTRPRSVYLSVASSRINISPVQLSFRIDSGQHSTCVEVTGSTGFYTNGMAFAHDF
ncbi:hypothetical protein J2T20_002565 [Paenibacillus wynnii]|nr:hypothetical protein [Paenibacillus wynnii]